MGTLLYERIGYRYVCFEELNVTDPQLVLGVHRSYLEAGSELIETNTFACNRFLLGMRGLETSVERFAQAGARIAREAREAMGVDAFVAGAVGPINPLGVLASEVRFAFEEIIQGLLLGGVDLLILETFGSLDELVTALEVARTCSSLPVIASMTFSEDGLSLAGEDPGAIAKTLQAAGADVVSANCGFGPQPAFEVFERMRFEGGPSLGSMPNAGLPTRVEGRLVYTSGPDYFADYAEKLSVSGARIIGGCCGTTPAHIHRMGQVLSRGPTEVGLGDRSSAGAGLDFALPEVSRGVGDEATTPFVRSLRAGEFVITVEMRPSRGANPAKLLRNAELLRDAGVTVVDVTDSALGRVRMNPFFTAYLIQAHTGLDVIAHLTTRDRNAMALQSDLLGAHALGIRHVLALSGDPPNPNSFPPTSGVYDLDSIGLIALIKRLNEGHDGAGTSIGAGTNFLVGCSLNPTAEDLEVELDRFARKLDAGADFVMTQAVFDPGLFTRVLDRIGPLEVPLILELLSLQNFKNAEFIHNELAGVELPAEVLARMRASGAQGIETGMEITRETFHALAPLVQGVYLIPSFDRYEQAAQLAREFRSA
jgi:homocysteine S-methyltransferase